MKSKIKGVKIHRSQYYVSILPKYPSYIEVPVKRKSTAYASKFCHYFADEQQE